MAEALAVVAVVCLCLGIGDWLATRQWRTRWRVQRARFEQWCWSRNMTSER